MTMANETMLYPGARWTPLVDHSLPGHLAWKDMIILHITQGPTAAGAIETFRASIHPHRVSAHFVIDRDDVATVYQLLDVSDVAWHASQANSRSVAVFCLEDSMRP